MPFTLPLYVIVHKGSPAGAVARPPELNDPAVDRKFLVTIHGDIRCLELFQSQELAETFIRDSIVPPEQYESLALNRDELLKTLLVARNSAQVVALTQENEPRKAVALEKLGAAIERMPPDSKPPASP